MKAIALVFLMTLFACKEQPREVCKDQIYRSPLSALDDGGVFACEHYAQSLEVGSSYILCKCHWQ